MWTWSLSTLACLTVLTTAQQQQWGWHPGPSYGHNNNSAQVIDLTGSNWTLTSQNGSIQVPANVPSQHYIDLFNAGIIGDPLYGENDTMLTWVRDQNWTYSRTVNELASGAQGNWTSTLLVFEGLDTFTTISFCGTQIGYTENQFRQHVFDISDLLRSCQGSPELLLNFGPAVNITHEISTGPYQDGVVNYGTQCNDDPGQELSCKAYARKEQNDFGWDWSPALVPAGPWKPLYAVQYAPDTVYVNNAAIDIYRQGQMNNLPPDQSQPWVFNASIDFTGSLPNTSTMLLTLTDAGGQLISQTPLGGVYSSNSTITGSITIDPSSVEQWWPNGLGSQPLYTAQIDIVAGDSRSGPNPIASVTRRVGFRTIVLNLGDITDEQLALGVAPGSNWHFEINGNEFYAKGSNLVSADVFWPRVDEAKITTLFTLAKDARMNLLRVWSSGAYLDDWIYDMADEMGLLLWSEFEFSDAPYPANDHYFAEYEAEAYFNVRRVNHHPSLALWVGGNELEAVLLQYFFGGQAITNYQEVFEELLIKCVYANSKSISYIPSSTYNGYLSLDFDSVHPMVSRYKNTSGPGYYYSDTDAYNYNATTLFDFNSFPTGRFADEFGFISIPSIQTWEQEAPASDLYYPSDTMVNHNRHVPFGFSAAAALPPDDIDSQIEFRVTDVPSAGSLAGIAEMTAPIQMYLPSPNLADSRANFSAWCLATQIIQADAIVHQIAFYRRGSGMPERQLGSLYWQLNDVWAAPTWASIEATGRQKVLHYAAKDIYSPVIVYPYYNRTTTELEIWVTSDLWDPVSGTVEYKWVDFSGNPLSLDTSNNSSSSSAPHANSTSPSSNFTTSESTTTTTTTPIPFTVGPINTTLLLSYPSLPPSLPSNAVLFLNLTSPSNSHSYHFAPTPLRNTTLPDPGLTLTPPSSSGSSSNTFTVTATKAVAAWVWLDYDTSDALGYWSENGFWLDRGESRTVTFTVLWDSTGGGWTETVNVRSVFDFTVT